MAIFGIGAALKSGVQAQKAANSNANFHAQSLYKLSNWCLLTAMMIVGMVVLGGYTRLTGSGLSMVDWRPITGFLPPLNADEWQRVFALYQTSPEYTIKNFGMTIEGFKGIFWLEFIHRLWGRIIGIVFLVPVVFTLIKPALRPWFLPMLGVFALGALQGLMGWYMVKSGLSHDPEVSPYRLCAHLLLAFLTAALLVWSSLKMRYPHYKSRFWVNFKSPLTLLSFSLMFLTIVYGAFVAGMKAGLLYNTFPLMGDAFVPSETFFHDPWYINFVANPVTVQLTHRVLALLTLYFVWMYGLRELKKAEFMHHKKWIVALLGWSVIQVSLGIATLLSIVQHDLAVMHQVGALALVLLFLGAIFFKSNQAD